MLYIKVGTKQNDHFECVPECLRSPGNVRIKADSSLDRLMIIQHEERTRACGLHRYNQYNRDLVDVHMSGNRNLVNVPMSEDLATVQMSLVESGAIVSMIR